MDFNPKNVLMIFSKNIQKKFSLLTSILMVMAYKSHGLSQAQTPSSSIISLKYDQNIQFQTIHSFGASDCWSIQMVGKHYPESKKEKIAELLFSKENHPDGSPKGIGLSKWRFNIGAGSTEQGQESKITNVWRRAECFLNADGTYNWDKHEGQRWFLNAARRYNVKYTLGFLNSPPVYFTKNGLAIASGVLGDYNFKPEKLDVMVDFLGAVCEKLKFDYISPFNEPQWDWGPKNKDTGFGNQEGTPAMNSDILTLTKALNQRFINKNINTKIILGEAGQIDYLYKLNTNRSKENIDNQIEYFFSNTSTNIKSLEKVEQAISGHSYFTTSPFETSKQMRQSLAKKISQYQVSYWQSEYCVLGANNGEINGNKQDLGMNTAMYVAKVIHTDLAYANASSWDWWLSVSANDYKDGLVYLSNKGTKGENNTNKYDADVLDSKTLWAMGNFSRFVLPNMKRISLTSSRNTNDFLATAYFDTTKRMCVIVVVNDSENQTIKIENLNDNSKVKTFTTNEIKSLKLNSVTGNIIKIPSKSIMTIVIEN